MEYTRGSAGGNGGKRSQAPEGVRGGGRGGNRDQRGMRDGGLGSGSHELDGVSSHNLAFKAEGGGGICGEGPSSTTRRPKHVWCMRGGWVLLVSNGGASTVRRNGAARTSATTGPAGPSPRRPGRRPPRRSTSTPRPRCRRCSPPPRGAGRHQGTWSTPGARRTPVRRTTRRTVSAGRHRHGEGRPASRPSG